MFVGDGDPCHKHFKYYWTDHATKIEMMKLNFEIIHHQLLTLKVAWHFVGTGTIGPTITTEDSAQ